jgi:hypothetical protein
MFNIDKETWTICWCSEPVVGEGVYNFSTEAALKTIADAQEAKPKATKKAAAAKAAPKKRGRSANGNSKLDQAAALLLRKSGATAAELRERLGWNDGSIGIFMRWMGFAIRSGIKTLSSEKSNDGTVTYKAA